MSEEAVASVRVQQEAGEDAVTFRFPPHPSVVFGLQPDLLTPRQVDRQAAGGHLQYVES